MDVRITGGAELARVAARLREAGEVGLRRKLKRAATDSVTPLKRAVVAGLPGYLPNRYAGVMAGALRFRTTNESEGVRVAVTAKGRRKQRAVPAINAGVLRHPVYGNRKRWVAQPVKHGFVTEPIKHGRSKVERRISHAMEEVAEKIAHGRG